MILKLFTQPCCPKCPTAKKVFAEVKSQSFDKLRIDPERSRTGQKLKVKTEEFDVSTVDGLAEASFYTVMATPTLLLCDNKGKIVKDWRGETPRLEEIISLLG